MLVLARLNKTSGLRPLRIFSASVFEWPWGEPGISCFLIYFLSLKQRLRPLGYCVTLFQPQYTLRFNLGIPIVWKWPDDLKQPIRIHKFHSDVNLNWKTEYCSGGNLHQKSTNLSGFNVTWLFWPIRWPKSWISALLYEAFYWIGPWCQKWRQAIFKLRLIYSEGCRS